MIGWRLRNMISSSGGTVVQAYDQDAWAANQGYGRMDPTRSLETFRVLRAFTWPYFTGARVEHANGD